MAELVEAELRTTLAPPLRVGLSDLAGSGTGRPGPGGILLSLLRPSVTVRTPIKTIHEAPAGEPGDAWMLVLPALAVGVLLVLVLAAVGVVSLARR